MWMVRWMRWHCPPGVVFEHWLFQTGCKNNNNMGPIWPLTRCIWKLNFYPSIKHFNSVKLNDLDLLCFQLANTIKYGGGVLFNLFFTEWRHCVSQNEVWRRGSYITLFSSSDVTAFHRIDQSEMWMSTWHVIYLQCAMNSSKAEFYSYWVSTG